HGTTDEIWQRSRSLQSSGRTKRLTVLRSGHCVPMDTSAEKRYWEHVRRQGVMLMVTGTAATVVLKSASMWHPIIATVMTYFSALGTIVVTVGNEFRGDLSRTAFGTAIAGISSF